MLSRTSKLARNALTQPHPRLLPRLSQRCASDVPKNTGHTVDKLEGVYDNAFNRERLAVKKHAAETAGE